MSDVSREEFEELKAAFEEEREQRRALEDRVDELEEENEQLRERVDDAEGDVEFLSQSVWNLEDVVTGETHDVATASMCVEEKGGVLERVEDVEDEIEETPDDAVGVEDAEDLLPIQQVARTPDANLNARERRAKFLWRDLKDYTRQAPNGRVITSPEAKRVLSAAEPDDSDADTIDTTMVKRVFDRIATTTRGAAEMKKVEGSWRLFIPNNWREIAESADPPEAVTAASGGT